MNLSSTLFLFTFLLAVSTKEIDIMSSSRHNMFTVHELDRVTF